MTQQPLAYFDNAASTQPMHVSMPDAIWGNANSPHGQGQHSKHYLLVAKTSIANLFGMTNQPDSVLCVSGGTEASNMVLSGKWDLVLSTQMEHEATLRTLKQKATAPASILLPNNTDGCIDIPASTVLIRNLKQKYKKPVGVLLSVIWVNNEIGTIQTEADLLLLYNELNATLPPGSKVRVHLDAVQAVGHVPLSLAPNGNLHFVHYISVSAHKWHGPMGIGFLISKDHTALNPLLYGGSQQGGLRPGTEPVALVVRASLVLHYVLSHLADAERAMQKHTTTIRRALEPFISNGTVLLTGHSTHRSANHLSFCVKNAEGKDIIAALGRCNIAVSSGSACTSNSNLPSHVLLACKIPAAYLYGAVRITSSMMTTTAEVTRLCRVLILVLSHIQGKSLS
jgi:cysteine desulfurase